MRIKLSILSRFVRLSVKASGPDIPPHLDEVTAQ